MAPETSGPDAIVEAFVHAIASKERDALVALFDPDVDFRGLTPGSEWRATDPDQVAEIILGSWFEPTDHVRDVVRISTGAVVGRHSLRYRFRVENADGMHEVEQQGYLSISAGRITRMSVVCSGFQPLGDEPPA
jgi:hypothetical protein